MERQDIYAVIADRLVLWGVAPEAEGKILICHRCIECYERGAEFNKKALRPIPETKILTPSVSEELTPSSVHGVSYQIELGRIEVFPGVLFDFKSIGKFSAFSKVLNPLCSCFRLCSIVRSPFPSKGPAMTSAHIGETATHRAAIWESIQYDISIQRHRALEFKK
jgi:hypothetical protein